MCILVAIVLGLCAAGANAAPNDALEGRITNGEVAAVGQLPYQVGISMLNGRTSMWCGGTLISSRHILTAAHCTDGAEGAFVYLGAHNIMQNEREQQRIYVNRSNFIVHERWNAATLANDISLIKLPIQIAYSDRISAATLPQRSGTYASYAGEEAIASGWGLESDQARGVSPVLRYIVRPVMKSSTCNTYWLGAISRDMLCLSTKGGASTCSGDSGGPLVLREHGQNTLIGLTSFGLSLGCEQGYPAVFTRITSYLDWIEANSGVENN